MDDEQPAGVAARRERRPLLRALAAAGLLAAFGGLAGMPEAPRVHAAEMPPDTVYKAIAYKEQGRLVAVVLDPLDDGYDPLVFRGDGISAENLGNMTLDGAANRFGGMNRSTLADKGTIRALVYSSRTSRGAYAKVVSGGGNSHVRIGNPGQSDGDGDGGGDGGGY